MYRVLAESAPDAIVTIDETSTILSVNPAAERIFGYPAAELLGQSLHLLMPERVRPAHDGGMSRYLATGRRHISWQGVRLPIRTRSGAEIPVEVSFGEFTSGGRRLFAGFLRDVSERVAQEQALAAAHARLQEQSLELEQQVEEAQALAEELEQTNAELREAVARADAAHLAKDQFLATMSHELRTPLNAIGGYAELLELGIRGPVTPQQIEDLGRIQRSQRHLLALVNDVLDFARLEAGATELRVTDVSLADAAADVEALVRPQLEAKGLAYEPCRPEPGATLRADRGRVVQILANLLSNAIKFTPRGGRVTLDCALLEDVVEVRVTDTGIGIPPAQLERVFDPFTQVHEGLTRAVEGTGLGLSISRDLARAMRGDLRATYAAGQQGAVLLLTLPRR